MKKYLIYLPIAYLPIMLMLGACEPDTKPTLPIPAPTNSSAAGGGSSAPLCVANERTPVVDCAGEVPHAVNATKSKTCNVSGTDYTYGACTVQGCLANYHLDGETCTANACTANEALGTVSCIDEKPHSTSAAKTKTCNSTGTEYLYGTCTTTGCLAGYNLQNNACVANACTPNQAQGTVSCTNERPYSATATKSKTCNANGTDYVYGACSTSGCLAGYNLQNNACVPNACTPDEDLGTVSCSDEISYSDTATKTKTCNATGANYVYGSCTATGCQAGYNLQNNSCIANACTPRQSLGSVSCTDEITYSATATKTKTCNAAGSGYLYGSCGATGCLAGFNLQNNSCVANTCTPDEALGTVSCTDEIPYTASATKSKTCNATGAGYVYGSCSVSGCLDGYNLQDNSCVANACTPNEGQGTVSCTNEIPNAASATKTKTCNGAGSDFLYGSCTTTGCLAGFNLQGNSCVANTCSPNEAQGTVSCTNEISFSATATKSKTCNAIGNDSVYGACGVTGCLAGYNLQNNSCVPNVCTPEEGLGTVSCSNEISYSDTATKTKTCNSIGNDYVYGSCAVTGCQAGYNLQNNSCIANACTPKQSLGSVSCTDEITYSATATKTKTCNAAGSDYLYGSCGATGCLAGFNLQNNSCVANTCTPDEALGTVSCTDEIPYTASATKSKTCNATGAGYVYGSCGVSGCLDGYNLQNNSCIANACAPNEGQGTVSCTNEIPNAASATKTKTCNGAGSDFLYGSCSTTGCLPGFNLQGNSCVANTCTPNETQGTVSCTNEISYSLTATKAKTCNVTGSDFIYGACSVTGCEPGYNLQNNSCVVNACNPDETYGSVFCIEEISYSSSATKTKFCNGSGSAYLYDTCIASSCQAGYNLQTNSCIANVCTPNQVQVPVSCVGEVSYSAVATKSKSCNAVGNDFLYGACTATSCQAGYNLQGNSCIANACSPNQSLGTVSCTNEIPHSSTANKTKSCNAAGSDFLYGSCTATVCAAGYELNNNTCDQVSLSINSVSITEGNSGSKTMSFTVTLSSPMPNTVTVNFATANGTATSSGGSADYTGVGGTLTFAAGTTTKTIPVTIKGDTNKESNETFFVNLSAPTGGVMILNAQGTGTIINDD